MTSAEAENKVRLVKRLSQTEVVKKSFASRKGMLGTLLGVRNKCHLSVQTRSNTAQGVVHVGFLVLGFPAAVTSCCTRISMLLQPWDASLTLHVSLHPGTPRSRSPRYLEGGPHTPVESLTSTW